MPPTLWINSVKTLSCAMRKGVVHELTQRILAQGLELEDHEALLEAFEDSDLPQYGDKLDGEGFEALIAVDHHMTLLDDPGWAEITVTYKHPLEEEAAQNLSHPIIGSIFDTETGEGQFQIYGKMRCSLQQKPTNFFPIRYSDGSIADEQPIVVFHDFRRNPGETAGIASQLDGNLTSKQGGVINVQQPTAVYNFGGVIETDRPWLLSKLLIGSINKYPWLAEDEFTWMCTEVAWQILTLNKFRFDFQMTNNQDTWLYTPVWVNPENNKPHPKPVEGEDYWDIHYHREVGFDEIFGAFFENFTQDPS